MKATVGANLKLLFVFCAIVSCGLFSLSGFAQSAGLRLCITDYASGDPIEGVEVTVIQTDLRGHSDEQGMVVIAAIPPGLQLLDVRRIGYQRELLTVTFQPEEMLEADLALLSAPVVLGEIEVTAERINQMLEARGFYERKKQGLGVFVTAEEIEKQGKLQITEALRNMAGVRTVRQNGRLVVISGRAVSSPGGSLMSAAPCPLTVYVDGVRLGTDAVDLDQRVVLEDVAAMEVYKGPAVLPPQFNLFSPCGALVIWTKTGL